MSPFTLQLESKPLSYDRQDFLRIEQGWTLANSWRDAQIYLILAIKKKKEKAFFHLDALAVYKHGKYSWV